MYSRCKSILRYMIHIYFLSVACLFSPSVSRFKEQRFSILMKSNFMFSLNFVLFLSYF